jgi:PAS domain S-box-containing protein
MGFVENLDPSSLSYASWAFPLFLLLFNLAIPPILWAGEFLSTQTPPDYYVLGITLTSESTLLPTLAFLGGISSASAMVIVTTLALASMALNHLLLPASYPDPNVDLYRWLVWGRRMIIGIIIITSYGVYLLLEHKQSLVQLGLISFVAVVQFLPGIIGTLFWQRATRYGFIAGLVAGGTVWYTTLLMPLLQRSGVTQSDFNLQEFLGATGQNLWEFSTFWSLSLNSLLFVAVSLATRQDEGEERAVAACFGDKLLTPPAGLPVAASPEDITTQLVPIIGESAAIAEVNKALKDLALPAQTQNPEDMTRLRDQIERNLSGMLGPMLARMIVYSRVQVDQSTREALADQMRFVEHQLERSRTQLRGLTRELDDLRRYHQRVLHDLPLGACAISASGEILNWNEAMAKLTGVKATTAVGSRVAKLCAPWAELFVEFLQQGQRHFHKQRVRVDGRPRWLNLHKAATAASPSGLTSRKETNPYQQGVVILLEDLTEVQTLETELAHSERLASIGRLAAGVAHEIGNPLTGIASITQNLRYETEPETTQEGLDDILEQIGRIDTIVKSLMTFSHGGGPDGQIQEAFDLAQCVTDAERLVRLSRGDKQIRHSLDLAEGLTILGDRQRMQQVVVNLLTNARDAVPAKGHVAITLKAIGDNAIVSVEDDGVGIPEKFRDRIFEPFFTTKQPGDGTGLGLPLAYSIVRDHSGTIKINAGSVSGTRVTLTLPLHEVAEVSSN